MLRPSNRILHYSLALIGLALGLACYRIYRVYRELPDNDLVINLGTSWWILFSGLVLAALIDALRRGHLRGLSGRRDLPHALSLNHHHKVHYHLANESDDELRFEFYDRIPVTVECSDFPLKNKLPANQGLTLIYSFIPKERGDAYFQQAQLLVTSRWGLWNFVVPLGNTSEIKVYPNFSVVSNAPLINIERNMNVLGAHLSQKRGEGMEFHQLREFRIGDTLKQVDWKATARLNKPISREYQEEKDQYLVFLLDNSRRMRSKEDNLSYFDHALNALLVNSYMALGKGDAVGVLTFSGSSQWLSPIKGKSNINHLLNHLYSVETSTDSGDYVNAAESLMQEHRKRSLVVIITNLHDEDHNDILLATKLLAKNHLVMVVALQERLLSDIDQQTVKNIDSAIFYAGLSQFEQKRKSLLNQLKGHGVIVVNSTHKDMHIKLLHEYLQLKRIGRI